MSAMDRHKRFATTISSLLSNTFAFDFRRLKVLLIATAIPVNASAINIVVDYTYDTNNFFASSESRTALEAAAARFSRIIDSSLLAVGPAGTGTGTSAGWRVGFTHPGTGAGYQLSTAASAATDPFGGGADVYGFGGLAADEWILFAGGRALGSAGIGGTGTGLNTLSTFNDLNGPMHRGLIPNTPGNTVNDLPVWGGGISFDSGRAWNFDLGSTSGDLDFYSIALHEIGHALGLSTSWNQWSDFEVGSTFTGPNAVAAYNADNGTALGALNQVSATNEHFEDGTYESFIFSLGSPNTVGTVPDGTRQDLLMEPIANFGLGVERFELTNVDVGALQDLGWSVAVPVPAAVWMFGSGMLLLFGVRRQAES